MARNTRAIGNGSAFVNLVRDTVSAKYLFARCLSRCWKDLPNPWNDKLKLSYKDTLIIIIMEASRKFLLRGASAARLGDSRKSLLRDFNY
jgi:hypothetical protein